MKCVAPAGKVGLQVDRALKRLRMVFQQIPGVRLSLAEASRVTELEAHLCQILLSALDDLKFVRRQADGFYHLQSSEQNGTVRNALPSVRRPGHKGRR